MITVTRTEVTVSRFDRQEVIDMLAPDTDYLPQRVQRGLLATYTDEELAEEFERQFTAEADINSERFDGFVRDIDSVGDYDDDWAFEVSS